MRRHSSRQSSRSASVKRMPKGAWPLTIAAAPVAWTHAYASGSRY